MYTVSRIENILRHHKQYVLKKKIARCSLLLKAVAPLALLSMGSPVLLKESSPRCHFLPLSARLEIEVSTMVV